MNCANCGKEIYCTIAGVWYHIGGIMFCDTRPENRDRAEPTTEKSYCKHCDKEVYFDDAKLWIHSGWGLYCDYPVIRERFAEPKEHPEAPTDLWKKCNYCSRLKQEIGLSNENLWFCDVENRIIGQFPVGATIPKPGWCIFKRQAKDDLIILPEPEIDKPKKCKHCWKIIHKNRMYDYYVHEDGLRQCRYVNAEPEDDLIILDEINPEPPTDCFECDQVYKTTDGTTLTGLCSWIKSGKKLLFKEIDPDRRKSHTPPSWCPLKAKEPEKTYPIELKRRSVHDAIEYFVNLYSGQELQTDEFRTSLIDLLSSYFEFRLQEQRLRRIDTIIEG